MICVPSEDSDQPGHPPNLIRVFAVSMSALVLSYPLSTQWKLWSDWVFAGCTIILLVLSWGSWIMGGKTIKVLILLLLVWYYSCTDGCFCMTIGLYSVPISESIISVQQTTRTLSAQSAVHEMLSLSLREAWSSFKNCYRALGDPSRVVKNFGRGLWMD